MLNELWQKLNALFSYLHRFTTVDQGKNFLNDDRFVLLYKVSVISTSHRTSVFHLNEFTKNTKSRLLVINIRFFSLEKS